MAEGLLPPGARASTVLTNAGTLRVLIGGEDRPGTPAVLIHGSGLDSAGISWFQVFAPLAAHRPVYALDLPGFGGSIGVEPVGGPRALAAVVADAMSRLGIGPAVIVGVFMGGDVALNLALDHAATVTGLLLIAPGGLAPSLGKPWKQRGSWWVAQWPDRILLPLTRVGNRFVATMMKSIVKDPAALAPAVVAEIKRLSRHPRAHLGYLRYNQATVGRNGMRNDVSDRVAEIAVPTLFFHGTDDPLVDPDDSRRAVARMPHARLVEVPGAGHWAQFDAPEAFWAAADAFLADLDAGAAS